MNDEIEKKPCTKCGLLVGTNQLASFGDDKLCLQCNPERLSPAEELTKTCPSCQGSWVVADRDRPTQVSHTCGSCLEKLAEAYDQAKADIGHLREFTDSAHDATCAGYIADCKRLTGERDRWKRIAMQGTMHQTASAIEDQVRDAVKYEQRTKILRSALVQLKRMVRGALDSAVNPDAKSILLDAINSTLNKVPSEREVDGG
jgi:hypothetical protein